MTSRADDYTERERSLVNVGRSFLKRLEKAGSSSPSRRRLDRAIERRLYFGFHELPIEDAAEIRTAHFARSTVLTPAEYRNDLKLPDQPVPDPQGLPLVYLAADKHKDNTRVVELAGKLMMFGRRHGLSPVKEVERYVVLGEIPEVLLGSMEVEVRKLDLPSVTLRIFDPDLVWDLKPLLSNYFSAKEVTRIINELGSCLPGRGDQSWRLRRRHMTAEKRVVYLICWLMTTDGGGDRTSHAAQKICARAFGRRFDGKEYEKERPKLLAEFEWGHELDRTSEIDNQTTPRVIIQNRLD